MPASERSLLLTDVYRARLNDLRDRLALAAQRGWDVRIDRLDESFQEWLNRVVPVTRTMNALAGRFALAYLGQFIAAETGHPAPAPHHPPLTRQRCRTRVTAVRSPRRSGRRSSAFSSR
jgi:hypothetical protein